MIVRVRDDGVLLITQPDHAHLARRIMERCAPLTVNPRRDAILHAIGEHDNGWAEEDAAPVVNPTTGRVADFVHAPVCVRRRVWPRGVARLAADPWAAALVAQHALTIYDRFREDAEWAPFFAEMAAARDAWRQASGLRLAELVSDYAFVRLGDLISLTFCADWTDEQRFDVWTVQASGSRVMVAPAAFAAAAIPIEIMATEIPNRRFGSDEELRDTVRAGQRVMLRGEVAR